MKYQLVFSDKYKMKSLDCRLLQILLSALKVKKELFYALTLNRKFFLWSGPLSWITSNCGAPHFLLLHNSTRAETGCFPAKEQNYKVSKLNSYQQDYGLIVISDQIAEIMYRLIWANVLC